MLLNLTLITSYVLAFNTLRFNQVIKPISSSTDSSNVNLFAPKIESSDLTVEFLDNQEPKDQIKNSKVVSKIRILNWKLKKNLETLLFLRELEDRYENASTITNVIKEYYELKKEIKNSSVEIIKQLSYYKAIQTKSA